jgi:hypothetical protein
MDLANMRRQGERSLIAHCLNHACRHQAVIEIWSYPPEMEITYFRACGLRQVRRSAA